jgi:hypothetical protein
MFPSSVSAVCVCIDPEYQERGRGAVESERDIIRNGGVRETDPLPAVKRNSSPAHFQCCSLEAEHKWGMHIRK